MQIVFWAENAHVTIVIQPGQNQNGPFIYQLMRPPVNMRGHFYS